MAGDPSAIPPDAVERFAKNSAQFVQALQAALNEAAGKAELAGTPAFRVWQAKALPLLQQKDAAIQAARQSFAQGDVQPILEQAEDKRGLAKDMEGFPLTFAGEDSAGDLEDLQTLVVLAAFQLCEAAGIP